MFTNVVQPSVVSLFSSTGSAPLQLWEQRVDPSPALRSDSLIHLLGDAMERPTLPEPGVLVRCSASSVGRDGYYEGDGDDDRDGKGDTEGGGRSLCQTVLHMQSPTLRSTYIRCPPSPSRPSSSTSAEELGLTLPWLHMQVRRLGEREWAFEVGIVDRAGRKGVIRCSTFQKEATVTIHHDPPLLHIPIRFPPTSSSVLTSWNIISLDLGSLIQQFHVISAGQQAESQSAGRRSGREEETAYHRTARDDIVVNAMNANAPLPSGGLGRVTYVKVYANCRLRRIWFSKSRRGTLPWEFELYASS